MLTEPTTPEELTKLDHAIATEIMGWHRMTVAESMGVTDLSEYTEREREWAEKLSANWYDSENKHVADVTGECDCGQHNTSFSPTANAASSMLLLKRCAEKTSVTIRRQIHTVDKDWCVYDDEHSACAATLELCLAKFSKLLLTPELKRG